MRERAEPRREARGSSLRIGDVDVEEPGLERLEPRLALRAEAVPVHDLGTVGRNGSGFGLYAPATSIFEKSWKFGWPVDFGYASTTTRYWTGLGHTMICSLTFPSAPTGGCTWMIEFRSSRTRIRCTPVCGPAPRLYAVSGFPFGCSIVNETVTGLPACTGPDGWKFASSNVRAAWIVGTCGDDEPEPQPARTTHARDQTRETRPHLRAPLVGVRTASTTAAAPPRSATAVASRASDAGSDEMTTPCQNTLSEPRPSAAATTPTTIAAHVRSDRSPSNNAAAGEHGEQRRRSDLDPLRTPGDRVARCERRGRGERSRRGDSRDGRGQSRVGARGAA